MSDWFRNSEWDETIAAAFEAKLARARDKAQYLRIQGSTLKDSHPEAAIALLERCVALGEEFHVAHALLDIAHAHYVRGDLEAALSSLECTMEQEARFPMSRTSAHYDYAMLVALHRDQGRYDRALAALEGQNAALFASMDFQAEGARAIILSERGEHAEARGAAERALAAEAVRTGWIPGFPEVGVVPNSDNAFSRDLRRILAS